MFPMFPDLGVMKAVLKTLVETFGADAVYKEAELQNDLATVDRVARSMGKSNPKIARIKAVWVIRIADGLKESKEWVERFCPEGGKAPIT